MPWYPDSESVSFWKHAYIPAEELVGSIKQAMGDKTMAANLERIHNIYMDREEKPVKKVALMMNKKSHERCSSVFFEPLKYIE